MSLNSSNNESESRENPNHYQLVVVKAKKANIEKIAVCRKVASELGIPSAPVFPGGGYISVFTEGGQTPDLTPVIVDPSLEDDQIAIGKKIRRMLNLKKNEIGTMSFYVY